MTVARLRAAMANLPDDLLVFLASDEEGNDFHRLADVEISKYYESDGEIQTVHPDDFNEFEDEDDPLRDAVVLWP